jgi:oligoribonuclease
LTDLLVWVDCEMTGLDLERDEICEIAVIVTDSELNPLDDGLQLVIRPSAEALAGMGEFVTNMHNDSGLLAELAGGISHADADAQVSEYLTRFMKEPKTAPLAGNSIATDRAFLQRQLPNFEALLHYRNIDVSSIKELARRWYPRVYFQLPKKSGNHRALGDILESIEELRYYRQTIMVAEPGPSSEEARAVAEKLRADTI